MTITRLSPLALAIFALGYAGAALAAERANAVPAIFKPNFAHTEVLSALQPFATLQKDKYESSSDFTKRVCAATYKALGADEGSAIGFELKQGPNFSKVRYDPDKQTFVIRIEPETHYVDQSAPPTDQWRFEPYVDHHNKFDAIKITDEYKLAPGYTGQNAYGVARNVKVGSQQQVALYFPIPNFNASLAWLRKPVVLSANADLARKLADDLRIAIVARIQRPCIVIGHGHHSPTIQFPYDTSITEIGIVVAGHPEWVLYRASTNEVLKRGKIDY